MWKVFELYAVVFIHPEQGEGVPQVVDSLGHRHILIDSDPKKIRDFMPQIQELANRSGLRYEIRRFVQVENVTSQFT